MNNFNSLENNMIANKTKYKSSKVNVCCCCCNCCFGKKQNYSFFNVD